MKKIIITVDGPAASGKGKVAKYISKRWSLKHLDTGILYRRIAYNLLKESISFDKKSKILEFIKQKNKLSFKNDKFLRKEEISIGASKIAVYKFVRNYVNNYQREFVYNNLNDHGFVIDGRDIGSVVFKNANLKLYIEVNETNRAKRRYKQLIDSGEKSIYRQILKEIKLRDYKDKNRKYSPLIIPKGAYVINNNGLFINTVKQINKFIEKI